MLLFEDVLELLAVLAIVLRSMTLTSIRARELDRVRFQLDTIVKRILSIIMSQRKI